MYLSSGVEDVAGRKRLDRDMVRERLLAAQNGGQIICIDCSMESSMSEKV